MNLDIAGKTGTTNKNTDTWFIGYTSDLVVGVYIGYDETQTLEKFETGAKTAMPIFKSFIKKAIKKENTRPFKVPEDITLMVVDSQTGQKVSFTSKKTTGLRRKVTLLYPSSWPPSIIITQGSFSFHRQSDVKNGAGA